MQVTGNQITGQSEWSCCPGHRIDPLNGCIEGNRVIIGRDCTGQGFVGPCHQVYNGTIKGDVIEGQWTCTGGEGWWKLYLTALPTPGPTPAGHKLVAYYPLDGDTTDHSGNGNHGTNHGATFVSGASGQALSFDGSNDYVEVPDLGTPSQLTIDTWVYTSSSALWQCIVERGSPNAIGWHFYISGGNRLYSDLGSERYYSQSETITPNKWYHVAVTWDGSSVTHYVNGQNVGSKALSSLYTPGDRVYIGIRQGGGASSLPFNGIIDEVRIYNYALTASEIKANYNKINAEKASREEFLLIYCLSCIFIY